MGDALKAAGHAAREKLKPLKELRKKAMTLTDKIEAGDRSREVADEVLLEFGWTCKRTDAGEYYHFNNPSGRAYWVGLRPNPLTSLEAALSLGPEEGSPDRLTFLSNAVSEWQATARHPSDLTYERLAGIVTIDALKVQEARDR